MSQRTRRSSGSNCRKQASDSRICSMRLTASRARQLDAQCTGRTVPFVQRQHSWQLFQGPSDSGVSTPEARTKMAYHPLSHLFLAAGRTIPLPFGHQGLPRVELVALLPCNDVMWITFPKLPFSLAKTPQAESALTAKPFPNWHKAFTRRATGRSGWAGHRKVATLQPQMV